MKYEWKKQEKNLYGAKPMPALITVPMQSYIMIDGKGNPNDEDFSNRVAALYALAYAIKMGYKSAATKGDTTLGIHDFAVYPLEGIWKQVQSDELVKEELEYTIMIRQPDFITESMVCAALEIVKKKKPNPLYENIRIDKIILRLFNISLSTQRIFKIPIENKTGTIKILTSCSGFPLNTLKCSRNIERTSRKLLISRKN